MKNCQNLKDGDPMVFACPYCHSLFEYRQQRASHMDTCFLKPVPPTPTVYTAEQDGRIKPYLPD